MTSFRLLLAALLALLASGLPQPSLAGTARIGMGGVFHAKVVSFRERPFLTVVRQQFDYSCGSAALATLLRFHYRRAATESEVFKAMYEAGDQAQIQATGFSLLDMKLYLQSIGYRADGFRITLDKLALVGVPAIALIERDGYRHFVVIKGLENGRVLVGDPARGVGAYEVAEFERLRVDDIVFVIRDHADVAKSSFNRMRDWRLQQAAAPLGAAVDRRALAAHGALARIPSQFHFITQQ
jgi:predicted double-glycine peptidase